MALIADILLVAGALAAGLYCLVLSRRLRHFTDLERGVGGAVAVLSAQVDDMTKALERAREAAGSSAEKLDAMTARAETVAERLEILLAAMDDAPAQPPVEEPKSRRMVWRRPHAQIREADDGEPTPTFRRTASVEAAE